MRIRKLKFPETSELYPGHENYDYFDCYGGTFTDRENKIDIADILNGFIKPLPGWIDFLMLVRNSLASLAGLKTSTNNPRENLPENTPPVAGDKIGFFNVFSCNENEIILGENDKHLNFNVSLLLETLNHNTGEKQVIITTVVSYNNMMGSLYFFFVKPFHRVIVPAMMKKSYAHLND